jgi:chemotaxis protein methyltransferase CheR
MDLSSSSFAYLADFVHDRASIVLDESKGYVIERRLTPILYSEGVKDLDELTRKLRNDRFSSLHRKVLDAMTNNETWFFRDVYPFEILRDKVLPELIARPNTGCELSIWSAACSSGQEIYSAAMCLKENYPWLLNRKLRMLGTDVSEAILRRAQSGRYTQLEVNRGLPAALLAKYFHKIANEWELVPQIRQMASFQSLNLSSPWPAIGSFDVIFLRNVLIYFSVETRKRILSQVRRVLRPGGHLFLGAAETTMNLDDSFGRLLHNGAFYYYLK